MNTVGMPSSIKENILKELFYDLGIFVYAYSICNERLSENQLTTLINKNMMREEKYVRFSPNKQLKSKDNEWWADMDIIRTKQGNLNELISNDIFK